MRNPELVLQQPFFTPYTAGVANQRFITANNAVAGYNYGNIILAVGSSYGPYGFGIAHPFRLFKIADGFTKRYVYQFVPHLLLKLGAVLVYGNIKNFALAVKKFNQLFRTLVHNLANTRLAMRNLLRFINVGKLTYVGVGTTYLQHPQRALVICVVEGGHFFWFIVHGSSFMVNSHGGLNKQPAINIAYL